MDERLSAGSLLQGTWMLIRDNLQLAAIAFAVLTAVAIGADFLGTGGNIASSVATFGASWFVTRQILEPRGLIVGSTAGFGAVFGLSLLSGLGVLLGLVLLIAPGVFLSVRWIVALPVLLSRDTSISVALGESWRATKEHFFPIFFASLVLWMPALLGFTALAFLSFTYGNAMTAPGSAMSITLNFVISITQVGSWYLAVAAFIRLVRQDAGLAEVFA